MKTKIRTTEVKQRGADTDSMASRLQLGLSNRDISTKDELLRDAKESKKTNKEMLDGFKSKISNMLQNNSYLDETANVNIFENEHTKTHLAFRFMPDAFENFISFEGIVYAINSSGKLYVYTIEMKEEDKTSKDISNKKVIMNYIHPGSYILGISICGIDIELNPKMVNLLFSIPFYNEDITKKHFVINMLNFLKEINPKANICTVPDAGSVDSKLVVPDSVKDWVDNSDTVIKNIAAKRIEDLTYTAMYSQLVSLARDEYSIKTINRFQYSAIAKNYNPDFIPSAREGQSRKLCFLYWDNEDSIFKASSKFDSNNKLLGMAYSITDAKTDKVIKQAMFRFSEEVRDFIDLITIDNYTGTLTIKSKS